MSDPQACSGCRYSYPQGDGSLLCRQSPPLPIVTAVKEDGKGIQINTTSAWPPVPPYGWCGCWAQRNQATVTWLQPTSIVTQYPQRDPGDENPPKGE